MLKSHDTLVLTPTLGKRLDLLKRTVDSVKEVGGSRVKHILIAPTTTSEILRKELDGIDILEEPVGCSGIYEALNYAIKFYINDFKYFTYINDDDYWLSNFKFLFKVLDERIDIDVAYGKVMYVSLAGSILGEQTCFPFYKYFNVLLKNNIVLLTQQSTLMRSELLTKTNGYSSDYKLISDTYFWSKVISLGFKFKYINKVCAGYCLHDGQLSSNSNLQRQEHSKLALELGLSQINFLTSSVCLIFFRFYNLKLYFKRFFINMKRNI